MYSNGTYRLNPVLEVKRDGYLAEEKEAQLNSLELFRGSIAKTKNLHANILFTTEYGLLILKNICCLVSYVDTSTISKDWRDLAVKLGYSCNQVKCVNNLRGQIFDPTEEVLRYYAGTSDGTIGRVLQALLELEFMPALRETQKYIDLLLTEVETKKADVIETSSGEKGNDTGNLVKAANFKTFVPAIFNQKTQTNGKETQINYTAKLTSVHRGIEAESVQTLSPQSKKNKKNKKEHCKYVMLSFASDGYSIAQKVASTLRATTNKKGLPIGVLMLCENENMLLENPGQIITDILAKMDYVVPVLTEGYFKALREPNMQAILLDERYIQFIHDILLSKYIQDRCLNLQVRSIIPNNSIDSVYFKNEFIHDLILNAWKSENEISDLANIMMKSKHRNS